MISFKKENSGEFILAILFIIYLIMGYNVPQPIAIAVNSIIGKILLFMVVVYMFMNHNSVLAILGLFVAFDLIRRSDMNVINVNSIESLKRFAPSEQSKDSQFTAFNQFPYTLEQEVIKKMIPVMNPGNSISKPSYKPLLDNLHDAVAVNTIY